MHKVSLRAGIALAAVLTAMSPANHARADENLARLDGSNLLPTKAYGPDFSLPDRRAEGVAPNADTGVTEYDLSLGCIIGGVSGTGLSVAAGGLNVINLIAGGIVQAATPAAAYLALGGVVFASFCAVGQALTPAAMATYQYFVPQQRPSLPPQSDARYCHATAPIDRSDAGLPRQTPVSDRP